MVYFIERNFFNLTDPSHNRRKGDIDPNHDRRTLASRDRPRRQEDSWASQPKTQAQTQPQAREAGIAGDQCHRLIGLLRFLDSLNILVGGVLAFAMTLGSLNLSFYYQLSIFLGLLLSFNGLPLARVYQYPVSTNFWLQILRVTLAWTLVILVYLSAISYFGIMGWVSANWLMIWYSLGLLGFVLIRLGVKLYHQQKRVIRQSRTRVAVVGTGRLGVQVIRHLRQTMPTIDIVGVFDEDGTDTRPIEGCPFRGSIDSLIQITRVERVDEIILALNGLSSEEMNRILSRLSQLPINTNICANPLALELPVRGYSSLGGLPLLHVTAKPLSGWDGAIKNLEDRVLASLILLLFSPLLLTIAMGIKLDSKGPVLFRQKRYGFNNNEITVYKFRSMVHQPEASESFAQTIPNDPRVTRFGRFLRKSSFDELPQLINVLLGDMSLIGPRPHAVQHNKHCAELVDGYLGRNRVKPGMTGWAQVNGLRGKINSPEEMSLRVQYDLYYIDHWSLLFDAKILLLTLIFGFFHKNAY
ncbi:MAG: undecaprenyl-phosphate glucose phosphotransferase [Candidatus Pacebacteria bacterium]|nr:undecaprenyl-phosphate glucose phosphotransferase [Candidatus Paceibacterota bacterium]